MSAKQYWYASMPIDQTIYEESVTQKADLGQILVVGDRTFRYAKAGAALVAGDLAGMALPISAHSECTVAANAAIGATELTIDLGAGALTVNELAEGTLVFNKAEGIGTSYQIASHALSAGSAELTITLSDPLTIAAVIDSSEVCLYKNRYADVIEMPANHAGVCVGSSTIAVQDNYYFWLLTEGIGGGKSDTTTTVYAPVIPGSTAGGLMDFTAGATLEVPVGTALSVGVAAETKGVLYNIRGI